MWNPFGKLWLVVVRKGTEGAVGGLEEPLSEFVAAEKAKPLKGWRTVLINGGILAGVAFLHFLAGVNPQDLGLDSTTATIILTVVNVILRAMTTTPVGKGEVVKTKPISASDRVKYISIIVMALALGAGTAHAQTFSGFLGGSIDGRGAANAAGHACGIVGKEGFPTKSITCVSFRGGADAKPITDLTQGVLQPLFQQGALEVGSTVGAGYTTKDDGTFGLLTGGFYAGFQIKETDKYRVLIGGLFNAAYTPALNENPVPRFGLGIVYEPK